MGKDKSRGYRNNNPGNIRNSQRIDWKGEIDEAEKKDQTFEEFEDMAHGYRALLKLLQNYQLKHGCKTVADFINRWAPPTENNTEAYITSVCSYMGTTPGHIVDVSNKMVMCVFAAAISRHENGVIANMEDIEKGWSLL